VPRRDVVNLPDQQTWLSIIGPDGVKAAQLLALDLSDDLKRVQRLLVADPQTTRGTWIEPQHVNGGYLLRVPHPRLEVGVASLIWLADPTLLWGSVLIFPVTFLITSYRWHELLKALDIHLRNARTFVLNMVGAFYNTFMPGSTGGDLLKAYYA